MGNRFPWRTAGLGENRFDSARDPILLSLGGSVCARAHLTGQVAILGWVDPIKILATSAVITLWMIGAIYYDVCRATKWGWLLAPGWAIAVVSMFAAWQPLWQPFAVLFGVTVLFLGWWLRQKPSHNRDWDSSVAVLPWAMRKGDVVTIENIRDFEYPSPGDFMVRYETRTFHLANLKAADIVFFNWGSPWMSHPVLVFDFGSDGRVCMSIEVRLRSAVYTGSRS
jgi:hypothetical protein